MSLYRFSPIKSRAELLEAIAHIHFSCFALCKQALGRYLPVAGNMCVFCHYDDEYAFLTSLRKEITEETGNIDQKYYLLHEPIVISTKGDVPETTYTHLYIRKPDPYRAQVGDDDFVMEKAEYEKLKASLTTGKPRLGIRMFERPGWDMIELYDPDVDALGYISQKEMTEKVRVKMG